MCFWNIEKLKEDIRADRSPEKDRFIYALIYLGLGAIGVEFLTHAPMELRGEGGWDIVVSASNALIILGTILAFKANGSNDGIDFLGRYWSIEFVVNVRLIVFALTIFAMCFLLLEYVFGNEATIRIYVGSALVFGWQVAIYSRIYVYIKQLGGSQNLPPEVESSG